MKSLLAGGAIIATSFLGVGASASALEPQYPPQPPIVNVTLNLSITVINIYGDLNITFLGCQPGEEVLISFNGSSFGISCSGGGGGQARAMSPAAGGAAIARLTAPSRPGVYPVTATGLSSGYSATKYLTVVGADTGVAPAAATPAATPAAAAPAAAAPAAGATATPARSATSTRATSTGAASGRSTAGSGRSTSRTSRLPATGSSAGQTMWIAGATLLAGLGLAGVGFRRRQHGSAP